MADDHSASAEMASSRASPLLSAARARAAMHGVVRPNDEGTSAARATPDLVAMALAGAVVVMLGTAAQVDASAFASMMGAVIVAFAFMNLYPALGGVRSPSRVD